MPANRVSEETSFWSSGRPNSLRIRHASLDDLLPDGVDQGPVAGPEERVTQKGVGFDPVADGVVGSGRTGAEASDLGKMNHIQCDRLRPPLISASARSWSRW